MHMRDEMAEATRLTRSGRLTEATALIKRTLGAHRRGCGPEPRRHAPSEAPAASATRRPGDADLLDGLPTGTRPGAGATSSMSPAAMTGRRCRWW